jgi:hypothetical protein
VIRRIVLLSFVCAFACRPTPEPAPLAPDGDGAGSSASAAPAEPEPAPSPAPAEGAGLPNIDELCDAFAKGYCEPSDASPAAINPRLFEFVVLDCKKRLLGHPDPRAVERCVAGTKECAAMQECLPSAQ